MGELFRIRPAHYLNFIKISIFFFENMGGVLTLINTDRKFTFLKKGKNELAI